MPAAPRIPDEELEWRFSGSGGPGGQHANTANTRVEVTFDIATSPSLDEATRATLLARFGPRLRVVCAASRSQHRNRARARQLLEERVAGALVPRSRRRPTTPGKGAVRRRLDAKRRRSMTKRSRQWRPGDE
jgi:ribosome-associated protein